jgi:hypothetical protein
MDWLGPQRGKILVTGLETLAILLTINCQKVAARISGTLKKSNFRNEPKNSQSETFSG